MEKKITLEENQSVEINGVILTPTIIKSLSFLQKDENEVLTGIIDTMAESVCFITKEAADSHGTDREKRKEQLLTLALDISYYRDYLKELKKID